MKYNFTTQPTEDEIAVGPADLYREGGHAGFVTEMNRAEDSGLRVPELNSGFDEAYWYAGDQVTRIMQTAEGCYATSDVTAPSEGAIPLIFKCDVAQPGTYLVTVTWKALLDQTPVQLFIGRRRGYYIGTMQAGEEITETYRTDVSPIIARGRKESCEATSIDLALVGDHVVLCNVSIRMEVNKTPKIYIAGDSTVTDQFTNYPYWPGAAYSGWGQMLSAYIGKHTAVSNHAHSGLTTESFRSEGHYEILHRLIGKDDLCLFQFGHNDQKLAELKAEEGYRERLIAYIREIRAKGAHPVLVTPLARNTWKNQDTYNDFLEEYADAVIRLGREMDVPVIDLHAFSMRTVTRLGREEARKYYFPSDYTHTNDYGAYFYAGFVARECKRLGLIAHLQEATDWIPTEALPVPTPPEGRKERINPDAVPLFEHVERENDIMTRAEAVEFVIQTMRFFPTNVYNDIFDDIVGHETYAGSVECAYQNGIIPEKEIEQKRFEPEKAVTGEEFWTFLQNGYASRRPDALNIGILPDGFLSMREITRGEAAQVCRSVQI